MKNFKVGDSVTREKYVGNVVGFNGRGWPIVEWIGENAVLVEDPDEIIRIGQK
jgi:hypothetical protein